MLFYYLTYPFLVAYAPPIDTPLPLNAVNEYADDGFFYPAEDPASDYD
jgi:hypothetical protein